MDSLSRRKHVAAATGGIALDGPAKKGDTPQARKPLPHTLSMEARNTGDAEMNTWVINTLKGRQAPHARDLCSERCFSPSLSYRRQNHRASLVTGFCTNTLVMNNDFLSFRPDEASQSRSVSLFAQDNVALIKACQQHNQEAFALLVRKHQRRLFTLAVSLLQDDEQAAIITQDTFLAAWEALPSLPADANIALWLSHLISQRCLHKHQQRSSAPRRRNARREAIHRRENQRALARGVQASLPCLPTIPRVIVLLRYVQGLTYEEIALVLTLPIRTVKMHLFGARTLLKTQMPIPPLSGLSLEEGEQKISDFRS